MTNLAPKISLIIPAHNEAENIGRVLAAAVKEKILSEIIVVADNCQDQTATIAKSFGAQVVVRPVSVGKGAAMIDGFNHSQGEIIMFADADLETLTPEHISKVLAPVVSGQAEMSVGLRDRAWGLGAAIPKIMPMFAIGGERAMTRKFFESVPKDKNTMDFGIETVMNYYAKENKIKVAYPVLKNLRQVIKEKKWGFWPGFLARLGLIWQVWRTRLIMKRRIKQHQVNNHEN